MCGQPVDIDGLRSLTKKYGLILIEDASHSLGATYKGKRVGNLADITTLSFHPVKNVTTGEGGMITTNDPELAARAKSFRTHGIDLDYRARQAQPIPHRYDMNVLGFNYRITDIQCALGVSQLSRCDQFIQRRQSIAKMYEMAFDEMDAVEYFVDTEGATNAHHIFVIKLNLSKLNCDRNTFFSAMRAENIGVNVHYLPVFLHSYYKDELKFDSSICPVSQSVYHRIITLPCFPLMTDEDVADVIAAVGKVSKAYSRT
jgi:dTDP-4-amino-4,6-dideoxygalactose transaminase